MTAPGALDGALTFDANGLVPVVAQDEASGEVLLLAYMNAEALRRTLAEGVLVLWSRSRGCLWRKGERSGHTLRVRELRVNCEGTSLLARVALEGPGACHDGYRSCYYRRLTADASGTLATNTVATRTFDPEAVYGAADAADATDATNTALAHDLRALYAAYERLRDTDETARSHTSRLLRASDPSATAAHALDRAREELAELRGVRAGTHAHSGDERDVVLEASQTGYWVLLAAIALGYDYDAWAPHTWWLTGWDGSPPATPADELPAALRSGAEALRDAGTLCRAAGIHPRRVVAADLAAIRARHGPANDRA